MKTRIGGPYTHFGAPIQSALPTNKKKRIDEKVPKNSLKLVQSGSKQRQENLINLKVALQMKDL